MRSTSAFITDYRLRKLLTQVKRKNNLRFLPHGRVCCSPAVGGNPSHSPLLTKLRCYPVQGLGWLDRLWFDWRKLHPVRTDIIVTELDSFERKNRTLSDFTSSMRLATANAFCHKFQFTKTRPVYISELGCLHDSSISYFPFLLDCFGTGCPSIDH